MLKTVSGNIPSMCKLTTSPKILGLVAYGLKTGIRRNKSVRGEVVVVMVH